MSLDLEESKLYKYVYTSLDGSIYDIASLVHFLYKDVYKVAKLKSKIWYVFDGLKWKQSELGPYYELSSNVVEIYTRYLMEEIEKKKMLEEELLIVNQSQTEHELSYLRNSLKKNENTIQSFQKNIQKLKNVNTKEAICKECLYLFYDPDFLCILDTNPNLICFKNGILDLKNNLLRAGNFSDNVSLMINMNFYVPNTQKEKLDFSKLIEEYNKFRAKITMKRQNKLIFFV